MSAADFTKLAGIAAGAQPGTVTSVGGTAPIVSSGGTAPAISMAAASSGVNGYMTGAYATKLDGLVTNATHTGDATGSAALTLATVNASVGSYTNASITVNAKGLITAASSGAGGGTVTGSGTANYVPKWTTGTNLGNSLIYDNGTSVGIGTAAPTYKLHVVGAANGIYGSGTSYGVYGYNNGGNYGVYGYSTGYMGVYGYGPSYGGYFSGGSYGVLGNGTSYGGYFYSALTGVYAYSNSASYFGVQGYNSVATGTGVVGAGNAIGATYLTGGSGGAFSSTSVGVFGYGNNTAAAWGVYGRTDNATGMGVYGLNNSATTGGFGVRAYSTGGCGLGSSSMGTALTYWSTAGGGFTGTTYGATFTTTSTAAGAIGHISYIGAGGTYWTYSPYYSGTSYKIYGTGTVSTVVKDRQGRDRILNCPEAPEILFEDYGQGKLMDGKAHIEIDTLFAYFIMVNEKHPLRVFIQLQGDCNGVFVTNQTPHGFDVVELKGGTSSDIPFSYHVIGNRIDEKDSTGKIISINADNRFEIGLPRPTPITEQSEIRESKEILPTNDQAPDAIPGGKK
jgi:hypothetical protein